MAASDSGLCRVCVHWGAAAADLTLPAEVPVAVLIPAIVDILDIQTREPPEHPARYRLSGPGASALDPSTTLAQNHIEDGAVLVLTRSGAPLPAPRYFDVAEAVSATLDAAAAPWGNDWNLRAARLTGAGAAVLLAVVGALAVARNTFSANLTRGAGATVIVFASAALVAVMLAAMAHRVHGDSIAAPALSVIATAFAAVAGFVAVPGAPGMPNVLLAAAAAAVTAVSAMRLSGCGVVALTALSCCAGVVGAAALVGVITAASLHAIAAVTAVVSLGLLGMAARAALALAGLSPRPDAADPDRDAAAAGASLPAKAIRADRLLTSLVGGLSPSAGVGAVVTAFAGTPRLACTAFGAVTGALLLLRSRSGAGPRMLVLAVSGITVVATVFGAVALRAPVHGPLLAAATATLAVAAMYVGFAGPASSPLVRRSIDLLEFLAWLALVPLACWVCGLYGAARALHLT